jgi:broad specificity polyphosphatase/5'/3'-nucleotidase SurE
MKSTILASATGLVLFEMATVARVEQGSQAGFQGTAAGTPSKGGYMESTTIRIKVQYDAISRMFKLIDQQFKTLLEGDALYDLNIPLLYEEADVEEFISQPISFVAHA